MSRIPPPTPSDAKMSKAHLKDSVKYNMRHAKDHLKAAKEARQKLRSSTYFRSTGRHA